MTSVLAPVRYPLSEHSKQTLSRAMEVTEERADTLTVLHVDVYQSGEETTRSELKREVERTFGRLPYARYVVRNGFIVEETILEEVASENSDIVVIGHKQLSRWRQAINRLLDDPNIADFLQSRIDAELIVVPPPR